MRCTPCQQERDEYDLLIAQDGSAICRLCFCTAIVKDWKFRAQYAVAKRVSPVPSMDTYAQMQFTRLKHENEAEELKKKFPGIWTPKDKRKALMRVFEALLLFSAIFLGWSRWETSEKAIASVREEYRVAYEKLTCYRIACLQPAGEIGQPNFGLVNFSGIPNDVT
jgi:endonuclease III-like uncharacterized protein